MIMYVDDALFWQAIGALDLSASLILSFCQVFNFPISWRKLQLGPVVEYIGWQIHFRAGAFCLPTSKVDKPLQAIKQILSGQFCTCRELEAIIGLLHWVVQMAPALRPWLCVLYHDKARPLGTNFSLSPAVWQQLSTYLDAEMRFTSTPPGTSIRSGSKLLSVRHVQIDSLADLRLVRATGKRLWARVADPSTGKRKLSVASQRTVVPLCLFAQRLATLAWSTSVTLDTSHIAGCHNDSADWLSRWCGQESLPEDFLPELRVRCPLSVLWEGEKDVRLFPPNAQLTWQPPLSSGLI